METLLVVLAAIAALGAVAAAVGAWKPRRAGDADSTTRLADLERRLVESVDRLRETFDKGLRDLGQDQLRAQMEFQEKLHAAIGQLGDRLSAFGEKQTASFKEFQDGVRVSLDQMREKNDEAAAVARKELAEALAGLRKAGEETREAQRATLKELEQATTRKLDELREQNVASFTRLQDGMRASLDQMREKNEEAAAAARKELGEALAGLRKAHEEGRESQVATLKQLEQATTRKLDELREKNLESFNRLQEGTRGSLDQMRAQNEEKLERIRLTVEEKLQTTLEARLGESFKMVSERLEQVHKGLGEMQTLASGVGDLKRVLTNVRSRGTFGEVQLAALLEQVLTPAQYARNVATVPGSNNRVEFAILLPGRGEEDGPVHLPIDAKFPQEDYLRLQEAYEAGDVVALEAARRGLETRLVNEARTIHDKYVSPPNTTDFALLFLPTEGLYAEALRLPGVVERIQRESQVVIAGPTTLYAVLNSLQMGFRTLAIERRSSEVWKVLGAIKTEFGKFGESLRAVQKKLQEASNKLDASAQRSRAVERKLRQVEALPEDESGLLFDEPVAGVLDVEEEE
jgi:DNA recombination protein RmuC